MADEIDVEPQEAGKIPCPHCERVFDKERGLKIHMGRDHKTEFADEKASEIKAKVNKTQPSKTKPLIGKSGKFDRDAAELMVDLLAAGVAWLSIQYITSHNIPLTSDERDALIPDDASRAVMFRPLMDGLESIKPVTVAINTLATKKDYIHCFLAWREYIMTVTQFVSDKKQVLETDNVVTQQGPTKDDFPLDFGGLQQII